MPKTARFTLRWSEERDLYGLYEHDHLLLEANGASWFSWLTTHRSFSFRGRESHFNLLKERRKDNGEGYWYAYQRQGKRTTKRYVGRSIELVTMRLEEIGRAFQETQGSFPLLLPKLQIPCVSASLVRRERLLALLDAGTQRSLTLLSAPAGSGKTMLVAQWIAARGEEQDHFPPLAWVSLDKNDNDLIRFWRYVITACNAFQTGSGRTALRQLATISSFPPEMTLLETALTHFLNDLAQPGSQGILVLDDYQVITTSHIHRTLAFLLEHLPPAVHLVIMTRSEPTFPLARLRARGELSEIDAHDLRFSQAETRDFFQQCLPALPVAEVIEQIEAQLEGWATGLRLFALSLQRSPTEEKVKQQLTGFVSGHRPLHDYFIEEVLDAQTISQQRFLLRTCLLSRLTAPLCDAVTGGQNSAAILRSMERAGLFLERLDGPGQWYRYHALFAEAMRAEARRRLHEEILQAVLLEASGWYEREGMLTEAIELALQAQDAEHVAAMIDRYLTQRGFDDLQEFSTLRRWFEQLPWDIRWRYPLLCLHNAQILSLSVAPEQPPSGTIVEMGTLLDMAEKHWFAEDNVARLGEACAFRAYLAMRRDTQESAFTYARQALEWLPMESQHWRGVCLNLLGSRELFCGQLTQAKTILQEALTIWTDLHHPHGARSCMLLLATVYFEQGALHLAATNYRRVIQEAREVGDREDFIPALIGLAEILYEWNDMETAEQVAQEAWDASEQWGNQELLMRSTFILVQIWFLQGQNVLVQQRLASLLAEVTARPDLSTEVQLCQLHYWLVEGNVTTVQLDGDVIPVQNYLDTLTMPEGSVYIRTRIWEQKQMLQARVFLDQRKHQQACEVLEQLREAAQKAGRGRTQLKIRLLIARLYLAEQRVQDAHQTLRSALLFAHTERYLRSFLDEGREIATLLYRMRPSIKEPAIFSYLQTILHAFGPDRETPQRVMASLEPLSRQEHRVLRLLIAELSYPEIARELVVSVNTVKTQVNSIYRKLNVHSRREARAVVQDLHLFSPESHQKEDKNHERR